MKRVKKLLKKVNKIVENIDIKDVIKKIEEDKEEDFSIEVNEIKVYYKENEEYKIRPKNIYKKYNEYNNYDMEVNEWTSIKAS